jgi:hypothetical protein
VVLALRADPDSVVEGTTYIPGAHLENWARLALRRGAAAAEMEQDTFWITTEDEETRFPLDKAGTREWRIEFPLSDAWDTLVPGTWDLQVVLEREKEGEDPGAWTGSVSTPPIPLLVEEPTLRRIEVLVPTIIRLRRDPRDPELIEFGYEEADSETVTMETRTGFLLGLAWGTGPGSASMEAYGGEEVGGGSMYATVEPGAGGTIEGTHTVTIFEYGPRPKGGALNGGIPEVGRGGCRVLWTRSYPVAFSAAEIEALRR